MEAHTQSGTPPVGGDSWQSSPKRPALAVRRPEVRWWGITHHFLLPPPSAETTTNSPSHTILSVGRRTDRSRRTFHQGGVAVVGENFPLFQLQQWQLVPIALLSQQEPAAKTNFSPAPPLTKNRIWLLACPRVFVSSPSPFRSTWSQAAWTRAPRT